MRLLGKIFAVLLWLLVLLVAFCLLTALAWWRGWPLVTGLVILLGLFGLVFALYGLRALYRWRDKRRFVHKVLDEQAQQQVGVPVSEQRLLTAWQQGMTFLRRSPLRFQERIQYSQPWFVVLDTDKSGIDSLFAPFGHTMPERADSPLYWHFLSSLVLLRCTEQASEGRDWEEFLTVLAQNRRKAPLRGIVLVLDVAELADASDELISMLAQRLRARVQQLCLTMNRHYPVYLLVQGLDDLPGMAAVMRTLPPEETEAILGLQSSGQAEESLGPQAAHYVAARLEANLRSAAAVGQAPTGDMLRALEELRRLGERLQVLLDYVFRDIAHQICLRLGGLFFCQQKQQPDRERPAFLAELLTTLLPASPQPDTVSGGLPFFASTKVLIMAAWLFFMLSVCGLLAVNTIYQEHILSRETVAAVDVSHDKGINALYREMLYAKQLEKARKAWHLPTFGQDMLARVEREVKRQYVQDVKNQLLTPMLTTFRTNLTSVQVKLDRETEMDIARELMWLCSSISDRLMQGVVSPGSRIAFPLTRTIQDLWSPVTGQLLISMIDWIAEGEQLNALSQEMQQLLALSLARKESNLFNNILDNVNLHTSTAEICLSQFWPHIGTESDLNICIPPAYTATGYQIVRDTLEDVEAIASNNQAVIQQLQSFKRDYFAHYAALWQNFIQSFSGVRGTLLQGDVFSSYAEIKRIEDVPQMRLFLRMAKELAPLVASKESRVPGWITRFPLDNTVVAIALNAHHEGASSHWRSLFGVATTAPQLLQQLLSDTHDAKELRALVRASMDLRLYFDNYVALLGVLASPAKSLELASQCYSAPTATESGADENLYEQTVQRLSAIRQPFQEGSPVPALSAGMLDFIVQGVTVQAARSMQRAWEREVLSSPTALYRQDNVEALYGEKGVVHSFVASKLKPFLSRWDKAPAPAQWQDVSFPFTADFLTLLSQAEVVAAEPPQDTYTVLLRSQPTLVNAEARVRPDATELSLQCQEKNLVLINRNYPHDARFQYSDAQCGQAKLEIRFPSLTISRTFASFVDFLQEFQYGERDFTVDDFPEASEQLKQMGIQHIMVRILPDNVAGLLRNSSGALPRLPDRITYTW